MLIALIYYHFLAPEKDDKSEHCSLSVAWDAVLVTDPVALFLEQGRAQSDSFPVKPEHHKDTGNTFPPIPQPLASNRELLPFAPVLFIINFNKLIGL